MKLLMISMDRKIFNKDSEVARRQIEYAKNYDEVHIIVFTKRSSFKEIALGNNIVVYPTRSLSRWSYIFRALSLGRFIVERRNISHITCQDPFETGLVGALIKNRHDVSLELQIHTDIGSPYFQKFNFLNRIRTLISKYTLTRADKVRVVSERIKKYVSRFVLPEKIEIKPIAVDIEKVKNAPVTEDLHKKYPQFSHIILMVSRLEPEKNIEMAVKAWPKVLEKIPKTGLLITGSGAEDCKLKLIVESLKLNDSIIFSGWQNQETIYSYYKTAEALLVTSWYEGYGMTMLEAQAAHCPVVSTDVGIARDIGTQIVEFSPESIACGIIDLCLKTKRS